MTFTSPKRPPITAPFKLGLRLGLAGLLAAWGFALQAAPAAAPATPLDASPASQIEAMVEQGGVILLDESGKVVFQHQADQFFVPASIIKVLTAQIAIETLGPDHRFSTAVYAHGSEVWLQGQGDPFLISEELRQIAQKLKAKGVTQITQLGLDDSFFAYPIDIPGTSGSTNPYDALNGALIVNFNSLFLIKDKQGKVTSGEPETPLTPLALSKAKLIKPGHADRFNLTTKKSESLQYAGELFLALAAEAGIDTQGAKIVQGAVPSGPPILIHQNSRSLAVVLEGLLRFSNNFIANQIMLTLGEGQPKTLDKAMVRYRKEAERLFGQELKGARFEEASGLARENRITARQMSRVLLRFKPHAGLLSEKKGVPLKSGTLTGVHNYAGYLKTATGLRPFVIMLNQRGNGRDKIVQLLQQMP